MRHYVLTVSCKSTRGIVAAITGYLADEGCYITDSSQFDDMETGLFFMRLTFISQEGAALEKLKTGFEAVKTRFGMDADIR
ncbi:ACT domain-containing protein, partial [Rhizobium sp. Root1204]|uniref:ACT domain-containing protein n=1 Tax=Rhizobium sp. Root1204 TaxID=1736428 RepID=UPI0032990735